MLPKRASLLSALLAWALVAAAPAAGQQGTIAGTVTDAGSGQPLPEAQVSLEGQSVGSLTNQSGRFRIAVGPGTYVVVTQMLGYATKRVENVRVTGGLTTNVGIALESQTISLDPIQVTVGKKAQKATEAPATVSVVPEARIEEKVTTTPIEHLKDVVGVDVINYGLSAGNVVLRGFNNIFSGAVHFLTDNRVASIPSLAVNLMQFVPSTDDDIERVEVVLGPGSALYGPNTANGVLHFITRSPLEGSQTTISAAGGERSIFKGALRTSQQLSPTFGIKVSGQLFRGDEFPFADSVEVRARRGITTKPDSVKASLKAQGYTDAEIATRMSRIGVRNYDIQRFGGEARADWRFVENGTLILQAGLSSNDGIELTGLGAGQTDDWIYSYYQARVNFGRLFAQGYLNTSESGDSYLVRSGGLLIDKSKMVVGQLQNGNSLFGEKLDVIYGLDYKQTKPESEGTIYGKYEADDQINEFGAYSQAEAKLGSKLDLIGALRYDESTAMEDGVWSPRAALVFRPKVGQTLRASYNRAFSTPSTLNMFLDINGGLAPKLEALGFQVRATGPGTEGLSFQNADKTLKGMRSPLNPAATGGAKQLLPVDVSTLWRYAMGLLVAQGKLTAAQAGGLTSAQIMPLVAANVKINSYDAVTGGVTPLASTVVPEVPRLEPSTTTTYEVGYQGIFGNKVGIAADAWWSSRENFTSPLTVWTPLLTIDRPTMQAVLTQAFQAQGLPAAQAAATAAAIAGGIGSVVGASGQGQSGVPLAVSSSSDIQTNAAELVTTYVNYGDVDLSGIDLSLTAFLTPEWTLGATASWVSDDFFRQTPNTAGAKEQIVALNAPDMKGSLTLGYRGASNGFMTELRSRFTSEFPANSAGYVGTQCVLTQTELAQAQAASVLVEPCVESAAVFDLTAGYHVRNTGATIQLYVSNVFDSDYRNFVGVPDIGRVALLGVKYEF